MPHSIPKTLSSRPWLLPVLAFLGFVALWVAFIVFAVQNKPQEVERIGLELQPSKP